MSKRNGNAHSVFLIFLLSAFAALFADACGGEDDLGEISEDLANRLTEALAFENRTVTDGGKPKSSRDSDAPKADMVTAPGELSLGQEFTVVFTSDSADADEIAGAVAWVKGSKKHIVIDGEFDSESESMTLKGTLNEDEKLSGEEFSIHLAFINKDGKVGNYFEWKLEVIEKEDGGKVAAKPAACLRFASWSKRCGEFSYTCSGDTSCQTEDDSLCPYLEPDAAMETILNACIAGRDFMEENNPYEFAANFARYDECTDCMIRNLGDKCYFPNTIDVSEEVDQSQLGWRFLAPDCETQCYYKSGNRWLDALSGLISLIGYNLTNEDLNTTLKNECDY